MGAERSSNANVDRTENILCKGVFEIGLAYRSKRQARYESPSNIAKKRKNEAEEERQILMMVAVTDILHQLNGKKSSGKQ